MRLRDAHFVGEALGIISFLSIETILYAVALCG